MDVNGGRTNPLEVLPEKIPYGKMLSPSDVIVEMGEKLGISDEHVKEQVPNIRDYGQVQFDPIKDVSGKAVGFKVIGINGKTRDVLANYIFQNGKYNKVDSIPANPN